VAEVGISFDISNQAAFDFLRAYDFAWARRNFRVEAEPLRALVLTAETEGWSLRKLGHALATAFNLDSDIAGQIAQMETFRAANAAALAGYKAARVQQIAWIASSDSCLHCRKLAQVPVPLSEPFAALGEFRARKNGRAIILREPLLYPPLHLGCSCCVRASLR
jgi:hypothetical protein